MRRRRRVWALAATALLVGTALGVAGAVLRTGPEEEAPRTTSPTPATGRPIPTVTSPPGEGDADEPELDPDLEFSFRDVRSDGVTLSLSWRDPSDGEGTFHLSQTRPEQRPLFAYDAGTTQAQETYPLPSARTCFVMLVHMPDGGLGRSNQRCVNRSTP